MEPFVRLVVAGGVGVVAGLWMATITVPRSTPWIVGVALAVASGAALAAGIRRELTV